MKKMTKNFKIEGLDCANCARVLEDEISKINGVLEVNINFMMQTMYLEYDENLGDEVIKKVKKVIKDEEPDVVLEEM